MKKVLFCVLLLLASTPTGFSQVLTDQEMKRQDRADDQLARKSAGPLRTVVNRGKKAMPLTLADRKTTISLPSGWRCISRGFYSGTARGLQLGFFSHYFRPPKGRGGLHLLILEGGEDLGVFRDWRAARRFQEQVANGQQDALLWELYRNGGRHPSIAKREAATTLRNTRQIATSLGGLQGFLMTPTGKVPLAASRDSLMPGLLAPRYKITLFGSTKSWSFDDSTSGQKSAVTLMLRSFRPR